MDSVNEASVSSLVDMGFGEAARCRKALTATKGNMDAAIEWLCSHPADESDAAAADGNAGAGGVLADASQDAKMEAADDDKGESDAAAPNDGVVRSIKCTDTGKIFRTMAQAQIYSERTGHTNFEECTEEIKPLTEEEKAAKLAELMAKAKAKRAREEEDNKKLKQQQEIARRKGGQEMAEMADEAERAQRKRQAAARQREKVLFKKERERIRAQLEQDKRERAANNGKLGSKLGVDGYNPAGADHAGAAADAASLGAAAKGGARAGGKAELSPKELMEKACGLLERAKAGQAGMTALKTLQKYVGNIAKNPDEAKFRRINLENKAFKARVGTIVGGIAFLKGMGFVKNEGEGVMEMPEADRETVTLAEKMIADTLGRM